MDITSLASELTAIGGPQAVLTDPAARAAYEQGARYGAGTAALVLRPKSTDEVAAMVTICARENLHVVAQGGNTGLVGAGTPDPSGRQVVLSLERLRQPIDINVADRTATVGAGVKLSALNEALEPHGLFFPIELGADPTIGGMIATNTGGARFLRYGDVRRNVLGLEAVLADGTVLNALNGLRKNNTGIDFKQLFLGTGGAFGIVTRAVVEVTPLPGRVATALVVPAGPEAVNQLLAELEAAFGTLLTAFEAMSASAMESALRHAPSVRNPFAPEPLPDQAILVELSLPRGAVFADMVPEEMLETFLGERFETGLITNAVLGQGEDLWHLRHAITEGLKQDGKVIAFDIAVSRNEIERFRTEMSEELGRLYPHVRICDFGHLGDGGLHYNLVWPHDAAEPYDPAAVADIRDRVYGRVVNGFGGSFSAEHGIGPYNQAYYDRFTGETAARLAGGLKALFDPDDRFSNVRLGPAA